MRKFLVILFSVILLLTFYANLERISSSFPFLKKGMRKESYGFSSFFGKWRQVPGRSSQVAHHRLLNLLNEGAAPMSSAELAFYLEQNHTNANSLITAFEINHDLSYLLEAATHFPGDPNVQVKILMNNVLPNDRANWIKALKQSSPSNSFPFLEAAQDLIRDGKIHEALSELSFMGDRKLETFTRQSRMNLQEAFLSAGRDEIDAMSHAMNDVWLPHLQPLRESASSLMLEAERYNSKGEFASETAVLEAVYEIGKQLRGDDSGVLNIIASGVKIQNLALNEWSGHGQNPFAGANVDQILSQNASWIQTLKSDRAVFKAWIPTAIGQEVILYWNREMIFGEKEGSLWLRHEHPEL